MTKAEAIYAFWASFGVPAYEESSVPEDAPMPYIAYEFADGARGEEVPLTASLFCGGTSWAQANMLTEKISEKLAGGVLLDCSSGRIWLRRGHPFAQSEKAGAKDVRQRKIRVTAMFLTHV